MHKINKPLITEEDWEDVCKKALEDAFIAWGEHADGKPFKRKRWPYDYQIPYAGSNDK